MGTKSPSAGNVGMSLWLCPRGVPSVSHGVSLSAPELCPPCFWAPPNGSSLPHRAGKNGKGIPKVVWQHGKQRIALNPAQLPRQSKVRVPEPYPTSHPSAGTNSSPSWGGNTHPVKPGTQS